MAENDKAKTADPGMQFRRKSSVPAGVFHVPQDQDERRRLREAAARFVAERRLIPPISMGELVEYSHVVAQSLGAPAKTEDFLKVLINNETWSNVISSIPYNRRTLLLPPCLRSAENCKAEFDDLGLLCERCGQCPICGLSEQAEKLGYAVLVAEGTSIVGKLIEQGQIDAVIGVSCMAALKTTFNFVVANAVPGIAIPLLRDGCRNTDVDAEWVTSSIHLNSGAPLPERLDLGRIHSEVQSWFSPESLRPLLTLENSRTEEISIEWLAKAGKRFRPFLAACVFKAIKGAPSGEPFPDSIRRIAIAVECIHKASLIYDDIQDDDDQRYGEPTMHMVHGVPVALTASLLLLGWGYKLIAECGAPSDTVNRMLSVATGGHCRLCSGQGEEMLWMKSPSPLSVARILEFFRLKTAPSFDVVFRLGVLCAGGDEQVLEALRSYGEAVGVAYQVQDDMQDFRKGGDVDDIRSHRMSVILALLREHGGPAAAATVEKIWNNGGDAPSSDAVRAMMEEHGIERLARNLIDEWKEKAFHALRPVRNRELKILLYRVLGKVLKSGS